MIIISAFLGVSTGVFFFQQQQIYTQVNQVWQPIQKYQEYLESVDLAELLSPDFGEKDGEKTVNLEKLTNNLNSLVESIANDLDQGWSLENPISLTFANQAREVLIKQQKVAEESYKISKLDLCLLQNVAKQRTTNDQLKSKFDDLNNADSTAAIKQILRQTKDFTQEKANLDNELSDCFQPLGDAEVAEVKTILEPLQEVNSTYQQAVDEFIEGIDKLDVPRTEKALKSIKLNQVKLADLEEFDTFVKNKLEGLYQTQQESFATLEYLYQDLQQQYLQIRLRTLIK